MVPTQREHQPQLADNAPLRVLKFEAYEIDGAVRKGFTSNRCDPENSAGTVVTRLAYSSSEALWWPDRQVLTNAHW